MATPNGVLPFWPHGAKTVLDRALDKHRCVQLMQAEGCTALHLLPSIVRGLVDARDATGSGGPLVRTGMALTTDAEVLELAERRLGIDHIVSGYGLTETSALITRHPPESSRADRLAFLGRIGEGF